MKNLIIIFALILLVLINQQALPQYQTAVPFLTFPISPSQTGMGYTGASLPIDDPLGFLQNPAQLGYISQTKNLSLVFLPSKLKLWGFDQFKINTLGLNAGYNFKDLVGIPLSVGFGFSNTEVNIDYNILSHTANDNDEYQTFSLGFGIDYYVQFNAGFGIKNINSKIADPTTIFEDPVNHFEASTTAFDFGFLLNVPVIKLINDDLSFNVFEKNPIKPFFNISTGYSQLNIGDEIYYVNPAQSDPLPRTAKLGYGISTGLNTRLNDASLKVIGFDFSVDAEDLLLSYEYLNSAEPGSIPFLRRFSGYQSFIGDINIGKNIIQIEGDDDVLTRAGFNIEMFELFSYKRGHLSGVGYDFVKTNGYEIRTKGILKIVNGFTNSDILNFITNHIDLRYYYSNYSIAADFETKYYGIAIFFEAFQF